MNFGWSADSKTSMLNILLLAYLIRFKLYQSILRLAGIYPHGFGMIWWIQARRRSIHRCGWQITSVNQNLLTKDEENVRGWNFGTSIVRSQFALSFVWLVIGPFVSSWLWETTIDRTDTESARSLGFTGLFQSVLAIQSFAFSIPVPRFTSKAASLMSGSFSLASGSLCGRRGLSGSFSLASGSSGSSSGSTFWHRGSSGVSLGLPVNLA